jgi:SAM-dependent methyltransferase
MKASIQEQLVREMEGNLERHGDTFQGVGWTKSQENTDRRYQVMLDLVPQGEECSLLDIGCGAAHFYDFLLSQQASNIRYSGLDLSPAYLQLCRSNHPGITFYHRDILESEVDIPVHDYVLMNGVFNYKSEHSFEDMWAYTRKMIRRANRLAGKGLAFNFVSKYVDWERDDLFHVPFDLIAAFLDEEVSRQFTIRHDYGLYEYTVYVFKHDGAG